jgi:class 3 adenylate cyclase
MNQDTRHGYLILADITGYTSYLAGVELTHAQDVLTELLEQIVEGFKPLLTIVKLEGDAVFAHAPQSKIPRDGLLLDLFESTYLSFRDRVASILRRTTCECRACKSIPDLDLKFILHFGEYLQQNVSGITELVGSDVNLAHRLLKNHVSEATGWKAYALFTDAGLSQMNLELENLHEGIEAYEYLGEVKTYSLDLHARYQELIDARRVFVSPEEADAITTRTIPASPVIVRDSLKQPLCPRQECRSGKDSGLAALRVLHRRIPDGTALSPTPSCAGRDSAKRKLQTNNVAAALAEAPGYECDEQAVQGKAAIRYPGAIDLRRNHAG